MKTETIEYSDGGTTCIGHLAWDDTQTGPRPGIVVFSEAYGLNDHARIRAERLAALGFVALAADLHGNGLVYGDMASLGPAIQALYADRSAWRARALAAFNTLVALPQVDTNQTAAIGFCFGGATCFELARTGAPLGGITVFHAGVIPELPEDKGRISGQVLICQGADDPVVKKEAVDAVTAELSRDKVDWQYIVYANTGHSFTDPDADARNMPGFAYNALAEERSWMAMRLQYHEIFTVT